MSAIISILEEMGFSTERAKKAVEVCGDQNVEAAMEWLLAHADEPMDTADPAEPVPKAPAPQPQAVGAAAESVSHTAEHKDQAGEASKESVSEAAAAAAAKSFKCDECGKLFRSSPEVEFHAVKSGHKSFSESVEEVKPLTEEEKQEQARKLEEKIRQRRLEREEKEKKEAIEREKERRKFGQEIATTRQKIEEQEMLKLAEEKKREKMEAMLAKKKVLEDIERDKLERREKFNMGGPPPPSVVKPAAPVAPLEPKKEYDQCKLQVRLTNGQTLTQTFGAHEELAAVRLYVELNRTDGDFPFTLMTSFPRKVFTEEDYNKPLSALGLVPSAVVILTKAK
ncbi:UBX domain-containing protein 1-like [Dermacentor andersoni]|uniref:UBX domain-containing protein 1-like n=1 Tax=Dermacentor andersoni TaxID=34620 RepID=UPI0021558BFB|nr:UBX domain-containing protein 1-B-like [Dermacentor andersoni]